MQSPTSFVLFVMGIGEFVWGFWGDFVDKDPHPSPSISSRFEAGVFFLVLYFFAYLIAQRKNRKDLERHARRNNMSVEDYEEAIKIEKSAQAYRETTARERK